MSLLIKTKQIAVIDEIDGMNSGDKGINSLIKIIRPKNKKQNLKIHSFTNYLYWKLYY